MRNIVGLDKYEPCVYQIVEKTIKAADVDECAELYVELDNWWTIFLLGV